MVDFCRLCEINEEGISQLNFFYDGIEFMTVLFKRNRKNIPLYFSYFFFFRTFFSFVKPFILKRINSVSCSFSVKTIAFSMLKSIAKKNELPWDANILIFLRASLAFIIGNEDIDIWYALLPTSTSSTSTKATSTKTTKTASSGRTSTYATTTSHE